MAYSLDNVLMVCLFFLIKIVSGTLYGPSLLTSHVGGSVKIKFYYATTIANKNDRKFWCKESGHDNCYTVTSTNDFTNKSYQGRVSIQDFPQYGCLFVTMTQLEEKDSGYYRCGIGKNKNGLCTGVNLTVWEGRSSWKNSNNFLQNICNVNPQAIWTLRMKLKAVSSHCLRIWLLFKSSTTFLNYCFTFFTLINRGKIYHNFSIFAEQSYVFIWPSVNFLLS